MRSPISHGVWPPAACRHASTSRAALLYDENRLTRDVDASIVAGCEEVMAVVREIADERQWPSTWLNEHATAYLPSGSDRRVSVVFEDSHLSVVAASARHMIAWKARSAGRTDEAVGSTGER